MKNEPPIPIARDRLTRGLYASDASVYEQLPIAVAAPTTVEQLKSLIVWAGKNNKSLIPRGAGTSLAGQVVGDGIVVDVRHHMNRILHVDRQRQTVTVQPGVVRDELNRFLAPHGMMFGPETSTSNRATLGGMLGNNSCGSNSLVYGSVRDQVIRVNGILADGSEICFEPWDSERLESIVNGREHFPPRGRAIVQGLVELLSNPQHQQSIRDGFPSPGVTRRNTGYALDALLRAAPFGGDEPLNLAKLIAGSEGTLMMVTAMELQCQPLPPPVEGLLLGHFESVQRALEAVGIAITYPLFACELIDRMILEGARRNPEQRDNMEFVQGDPAAILICSFRGESDDDVRASMRRLEESWRQAGYGVAYPTFLGPECKRAWSVRKAGLGVAANRPGDVKPVTVVEDTAVDVRDLPDYIAEFDAVLQQRLGVPCVHYAHAGAGEIHLRPLLNLKTEQGRRQFREIATAVADLVRRYRGSLSGEHGDGRLRSEFIERAIGPEAATLLGQVKTLFDPEFLFNPGKIVRPVPMDQHLKPRPTPAAIPETVMNWRAQGGLLRATEMCSGSGDCLKSAQAGGVMCPSYQATQNERDSTRGRANILRQWMTQGPDDPDLSDRDAAEVLRWCLACQACRRECPSNVDMARIKSEVLQRFHDRHGIPREVRWMSRLPLGFRWMDRLPGFLRTRAWSYIARPLARRLGVVHPSRDIPPAATVSWNRWQRRYRRQQTASLEAPAVTLLCDLWTAWFEPQVAIDCVRLLERLGVRVRVAPTFDSGRMFISLGLLRRAQKLAEKNIQHLLDQSGPADLFVGIEPSALSAIRGEYADLVRPEFRGRAAQLAARTMMVDEFLVDQFQQGHLTREPFTDREATIYLHGHCHQRAAGTLKATVQMLQLPANYRARLIPAGCCGMAGQFGYGRETYEVSMQVGGLQLFPYIKSLAEDARIAAPGFSCRHQIRDGTGRRALHPVQVLLEALNPRSGAP